MDWRQQAACRDADPETFFPSGSTGTAVAQIVAAQAICSTCKVTELCLQWAVDTGQDSGIWGGLTEDERKTLRKDRVPA